MHQIVKSMENIENLKKAMESGFKILTELGYLFNGIVVEFSKPLGEMYIASFQAKSLDREVQITFCPKVGLINTNILKLSNCFNFSDSGSVKVSKHKFENPKEISLESFNLYLKNTENTLKNSFANVVNGKVYSSDPFDWSPYK